MMDLPTGFDTPEQLLEYFKRLLRGAEARVIEAREDVAAMEAKIAKEKNDESRRTDT